MSRVNVTQQNFTAGELSPKMRGRYDLGMYYNGAEHMENFTPQVQGPAKFRNGMRYITTTPYSIYPQVRLEPFVYSESDSYVVEFSDERIRFFRNNATVNFVTGLDIEAIEIKASTIEVHVNATSSVTGVHAQNTIHVRGIDPDSFHDGILNDRSYEISNVRTSTWDGSFIMFDIDRWEFEADYITPAHFLSQGVIDVHVCVPTTYRGFEFDDIKVIQYHDTMFIADGNKRVQQLTRSSHTSWTLANVTFGGVTFNAPSDYPHALALYEQRLWLANTDNAVNYIWGSEALVYTNHTVAGSPTILDPVQFAIASELNTINHVIAYDNFLLLMTLGGAHKLWGGDSSTAIWSNSVGTKPLHWIGASKVNPVKHGNDVVFVQKGGLKLRHIQYSFEMDRYEPKDLTKLADHITSSGVNRLAFQEGEPSIVWAIKNNGELLSLTYDGAESVLAWARHTTWTSEDSDYLSYSGSLQEVDGFKSVTTVPRETKNDQVYFSTRRTFTEDIYSTEWNFIEYMADEIEFPNRDDFYTGVEATDEDKWKHAMYQAQKESVHLDCCAIYDGSLLGGTLTSITSSTITGSGTSFDSSMVGRYIEAKVGRGRAKITSYTSATSIGITIIEEFDEETLGEGDWYASITYIESGFNYLREQDMHVVADGIYLGVIAPDANNGWLRLPFDATYVQVGLKYDGHIKTMSLEAGGTTGPAQTKLKSISKMGVKLLNTLGVKFGSDKYGVQEVEFSTTGLEFRRPPVLFSGEKKVTFSDSWERDKHVYIIQDKPLPCTVQMLVPYLTTSNE